MYIRRKRKPSRRCYYVRENWEWKFINIGKYVRQVTVNVNKSKCSRYSVYSVVLSRASKDWWLSTKYIIFAYRHSDVFRQWRYYRVRNAGKHRTGTNRGSRSEPRSQLGTRELGVMAKFHYSRVQAKRAREGSFVALIGVRDRKNMFGSTACLYDRMWKQTVLWPCWSRRAT